MWKILMFEISAKKGLCDVIWGSEVKPSDLAAHFSHNSGAANTFFVYYSNVQRTFKDGKIKSTAYTRPHAMKRHKSIGPRIRNKELKFWIPVNFEVEYFLNEETEGVLTDTVIYFSDQHLTWLSQLKPNAKVG